MASLAPGMVIGPKFVKCPVGVSSRFITVNGLAEITVNRHLPLPSPSAPVRTRAAPLQLHGCHGTRFPRRNRNRHRTAPLTVVVDARHFDRCRP